MVFVVVGTMSQTMLSLLRFPFQQRNKGTLLLVHWTPCLAGNNLDIKSNYFTENGS